MQEIGEREDWRKNHFATYLRTGRRIEVKFNPNHDPTNECFTLGDEDEWAKDLRAGRRVSVDITAHYPGSSQRPDSLTVKWSIDGHQRSRHFPNEAKGKKHDR